MVEDTRVIAVDEYSVREVRISEEDYHRRFLIAEGKLAGAVDTAKLHRWLREQGINPHQGYGTGREHSSEHIIFFQTYWKREVPDGI